MFDCPVDSPFYVSPEQRDSKFLIYALCDPDSGDVRYVGQTSKGMARPREHKNENRLKQSHSPHKANWIRKLQSESKIYNILIFPKLNNIQELDTAEIKWIAYFRHLNFDLTNQTDGGKTTRGMKASVESKLKRSLAMKGRSRPDLIGKPSPMKGKKHRPEIIEQIQKSKKFRRPFIDHKGIIYNSTKEAAIFNNLKKPNYIYDVLIGRSIRYKNFKFAYIDEIEKNNIILEKLLDIDSWINYKKPLPPITDKVKNILKTINIGRKLSKEIKEKILATRLKTMSAPNWINPLKGKRRTEQQKRNLALSLGTKPFMDNNGNIYYKIQDAARALKTSPRDITKILKGQKDQVNSHTFKYIEAKELNLNK